MGPTIAYRRSCPWWPLLKKSHSLEIVGLFSKMQTYASEAFLQATAEGQTSTAEEIRGFAVQFDELRGKFDGLPPVASGRPLGEVLETGEARVQASKALQTIDSEIAKEKDDDDSTNLSLAATIQALESLVVAWPTATSSDAGELQKRMLSSCAALEAWTFEAVTKGPVKQVTGLLQFAAEYDGRRVKLTEPEPEAASEALRPRLASEAAKRFLQQADQDSKRDLSGFCGLRPLSIVCRGKDAASKLSVTATALFVLLWVFPGAGKDQRDEGQPAAGEPQSCSRRHPGRKRLTRSPARCFSGSWPPPRTAGFSWLHVHPQETQVSTNIAKAGVRRLREQIMCVTVLRNMLGPPSSFFVACQ